MNTVKKAKWYTIVFAATTLFSALYLFVNTYYFSPHPLFSEPSAAVTERIQCMNDIEDLRKSALLLDTVNRTGIRGANEFFETAINSSIVILLGIFCFCLLNFRLWLRAIRDQRGEKIPF